MCMSAKLSLSSDGPKNSKPAIVLICAGSVVGDVGQAVCRRSASVDRYFVKMGNGNMIGRKEDDHSGWDEIQNSDSRLYRLNEALHASITTAQIEQQTTSPQRITSVWVRYALTKTENPLHLEIFA